MDQVVSAQVMLDLSGATSSVNQEFDYILLDGQGNEVSGENITVSSRRIEISAPVYLVKTLELTVDFTESPGSALEDLQDWYLGVTSIEVAGEAANLEGVDDILLATVDLSTLLSDTEMPLEITIPAGCVNISGITSTTLTILFKDTLETRAFTVSNISAIGLSQPQNFSRMTNSVEVLLRGDAQELEQVTADDIRIVVDLTPYEDNGTYSVPAVCSCGRPQQCGRRGYLLCGLSDYLELGGIESMTQIATVTAVPAPGVALVSVARQTACGHDCENCPGCGGSGNQHNGPGQNRAAGGAGGPGGAFQRQPGAVHRRPWCNLVPVVLFLAGYLLSWLLPEGARVSLRGPGFRPGPAAGRGLGPAAAPERPGCETPDRPAAVEGCSAMCVPPSAA